MHRAALFGHDTQKMADLRYRLHEVARSRVGWACVVRGTLSTSGNSLNSVCFAAFAAISLWLAAHTFNHAMVFAALLFFGAIGQDIAFPP